MNHDYHNIPQLTLNTPIEIKRPIGGEAAKIDSDSPASRAMTSLSQVTPAVTTLTCDLKTANQQMIERAVRMLFVESQGQQLQGIITSRDILGEKPLQYAQRVDCNPQDVQVQDIMTPLNRVQILSQEDIEHARVGDIIETLKRSGRHHALVAERQANGQLLISSIFSLSQISRLMNTQVDIIEIANSFAELEQTLHH